MAFSGGQKTRLGLAGIPRALYGVFASYTLGVGAGSYVVAGQTVALLRGALLVPAIGSYLWTGADVAFVKSYVLVGGVGSYALLGKDAVLTYGMYVSPWSEPSPPAASFSAESPGEATWTQPTPPAADFEED